MVTENRKKEKEQPKHHILRNDIEELRGSVRAFMGLLELYQYHSWNYINLDPEEHKTFIDMERIISLTQKAGIATLVAGVTIDFFIYDVDAGKRAVIFDMLQGVQQTTIGEGTHFKIPYIQVHTS